MLLVQMWVDRLVTMLDMAQGRLEEAWACRWAQELDCRTVCWSDWVLVPQLVREWAHSLEEAWACRWWVQELDFLMACWLDWVLAIQLGREWAQSLEEEWACW